MGYWLVDNDERYDDIDSLCDVLFNSELYDNYGGYNDWLNEMYSGLEINGREFTPSEILESCDEDLYNELYLDWQSNEAESDRDSYYHDLTSMDHGDSVYVNGYRVEYFEDFNEDDDEEEAEEVDEEEEIVIRSLMDHYQKLY